MEEAVQVDRAKIVNYLLNAQHPDGWSKAAFFRHFGFTVTEWQVLAKALQDVFASSEPYRKNQTMFGTRYTVDGQLDTPSGRRPWVRTVWIAEANAAPRLITAYPLRR